MTYDYTTNYRPETCSSMSGPCFPSFSAWELLRPCLSPCQDLWVQSRGPGWNTLPSEKSIGSTLAGKTEAGQRSFGHGCACGGVANGPAPGKKPGHTLPCTPHPQAWNSSLPHSLPSFLLSPPPIPGVTPQMQAWPFLPPFLY